MNRRKLFKTGLALAGGSVMASVASAQKTEQENNKGSQNTLAETLSGRRKLGTLEVSSVGLGVQNMWRTYQTTIPTRAEMLNIIRKAFDQGVTLFDTAEAYGPFESYDAYSHSGKFKWRSSGQYHS